MLHANYAVLDGSKVHYEVRGRGPAVVLIHGWTCDSTFWRMQVPALSKRFRVITLDLPGHGKSDSPPAAYDLKTFARAVDLVIRSAGIDSAVMVGHSMGVSVIRRLVDDRPARVQALVSVDGSIFRIPSPASQVKFRQWVATMRGAESVTIRRELIDSMFTGATPPGLREEIASEMLNAPAHVAAGAMEGSTLSDIWSGAPLTLPVLVINKRSKDGRSEKLAHEVFVNLEYHEIDDVGHFLHMEKPEEVNRLMIAFLRKVAR
jgi:pimeloyl-ACP methyl ester carboxylesterase